MFIVIQIQKIIPNNSLMYLLMDNTMASYLAP